LTQQLVRGEEILQLDEMRGALKAELNELDEAPHMQEDSFLIRFLRAANGQVRVLILAYHSHTVTSPSPQVSEAVKRFSVMTEVRKKSGVNPVLSMLRGKPMAWESVPDGVDFVKV
jgi:hypothetical protein